MWPQQFSFMMAKKGAGKTFYGQQKPLPLLTVISPAIIFSAMTHMCCFAFSLDDSLLWVVRKSAPRSLSITPSRVAYACSGKLCLSLASWLTYVLNLFLFWLLFPMTLSRRTVEGAVAILVEQASTDRSII